MYCMKQVLDQHQYNSHQTALHAVSHPDSAKGNIVLTSICMAPMADTLRGSPCNFNIALIHDLLTLIFDRLASKAHRCCARLTI